ncbi:Glycine/D-amino acid oxidase [Shimia gijangensis]|uniref:Glycine/D-amino acid oxidase n=1 Tax=Shimia gijangensis TaxID=1470563 RepID=A0A1M6IY31_9RHOB|nr:FAD-binding oxidoreductase [Shimia gijangensis]SHJ39316.1 Glycine/D-amino acid oxidase [Shimia gijangensis]
MAGFPITLTSPVEHCGPLPKEADVVIIGGGVIGVSAAYYLAKKGLKPVVLEKGRIAGEQSARNWGWIRQQGRDLAELPIMIEANRLWADIAEEVEQDIGLTTCGLTYFSESDAETASYEEWLAKAVPMGVDSHLLSSKELAELIPGMTRTYSAALHTPSDMKAEPWVAVPALARAAVKAGAEIVENCAARTLDRSAGRVSGVVTEQGLIKAPQVIVAGGAWSALFLRNEGVNIPQLSVRATVATTEALPDVFQGGAVSARLAFRRRQDGGYTLASAGYHEIFVGPDALRHTPKYLRQALRDPLSRAYRPVAPKGFPDGWGTARRWAGDVTSPFEKLRILDPAPHTGKVEEIRKAFASLLPIVGEVKIAASWAGMIDTMPDVVPVVDQAPIEGLSVCTGMCGHGFGIGPAFGRIMSDMVSGGDIGHNLSRFRFSRFSDGSKLELGPDL